MRLNKYIALAGVTSRRKADELILDGSVKVNGKVVVTPGIDVQSTDRVIVLGRKIRVKDYEYFVFNKPTKVVSSVSDPKNRKTIIDFFLSEKVRLFPVGRLDYDSSGLIFVTNDGDFANRLTHPSYVKDKVYIVEVDKKLTEKELQKFANGIVIDRKKTSKSKIVFQKRKLHNFKYKVTIHEGRNRQIRKMFLALKIKVVNLKRVEIAQIKLGNLPTGSYRKLTPKEYKILMGKS